MEGWVLFRVRVVLPKRKTRQDERKPACAKGANRDETLRLSKGTSHLVTTAF